MTRRPAGGWWRALPLAGALLAGAAPAAAPAPTSAPAQALDAASAADPVATTTSIDLPLPGGPPQRVLLALPPHPRATLVMLPGGAGDLDLGPDGTVGHGDNFVVRTRARWTRQGYAVLIPDTPDGASLRGRRSRPAYARRVAELVAFAHARVPGPVFLLGTSQGAVAAVNGAAHAAPGSLAGVVLAEAVTVRGGSGETVFDAAPGEVRVPALVVANRDDRCAVAPPEAAPRLAAALDASPEVRVLAVAGGVSRAAEACGSRTPHGYYGIEAPVVAAIGQWLDAHADTRAADPGARR